MDAAICSANFIRKKRREQMKKKTCKKLIFFTGQWTTENKKWNGVSTGHGNKCIIYTFWILYHLLLRHSLSLHSTKSREIISFWTTRRFFSFELKKINKELWAEEECITLCTNNLARVKLSQQSSTSPPPSVWLIFFAQYSAMIFHQQQLNNRVFFKKITVITSINLNSKSNGPLCTFY